MKKNQPKKTAAVKQSWQKGGAHRIAYDKRMQEKKIMDQRPSQPAAKLIGHPTAEMTVEYYKAQAEMACQYYRAACLLLLADDPDFRKPAERLIAQADDISEDA